MPSFKFTINHLIALRPTGEFGIRMIKKYTGGFTLITAATFSAIGIAGLMAYHDLAGYVESTQWVRHTYEVLTNLETTKSLLKEAETGQRGYIITGDPRYLEHCRIGQPDHSELRQAFRADAGQPSSAGSPSRWRKPPERSSTRCSR